MIYDSHVHSHNSKDGSSSVAELAEALPRFGVDACAVTDHCELADAETFEQLVEPIKKTQQELFEVNRGRSQKLGLGIELGGALRDASLAEKILQSFDFDVVLGSVHSVPEFGDIYDLQFQSDQEVLQKALRCYFNEIKKLLSWNKFDILTHLWYPIRYIEGSEELFFSFKNEIAEVLEQVARLGKALELNTKDTGKDLTRAVLTCIRLFKENGGQLVALGSDAHCTHGVGRRFGKATEILSSCGFKSYVYFEKRVPVEVGI